MNNLRKTWELRKKRSYLDIFRSVFSFIRTEYGRMRENTEKNNSEYGYFSRSGSSRNDTWF